jgi:hypothetical protein
VNRARVAALLVAPLLVCAGCRDTNAPAGDPGAELDRIESTLNGIEGDLADD